MSSKKNVMENEEECKSVKKIIFIDSFSRHGINSPLLDLDKMRKRGGREGGRQKEIRQQAK